MQKVLARNEAEFNANGSSVVVESAQSIAGKVKVQEMRRTILLRVVWFVVSIAVTASLRLSHSFGIGMTKLHTLCRQRSSLGMSSNGGFRENLRNVAIIGKLVTHFCVVANMLMMYAWRLVG